MARSKIIKDFVSEEVSLEIALKRLLVLLDSLENEELIKWAKSELAGYIENRDLPSYRKVLGGFFGTYTVPGPIFGKYTRYENTTLPTSNFSSDTINDISTMNIGNSVGELENAKDIGLVICYPPQLYNLFEAGTKMLVESAHLKCDMSQIIRILDNIKTRVIEILLKLEKEFGNLDDLDIDTSIIKEEKLNRIANNLLVIIQDNSINVGNNNKLQKTELLSNSISQD